MGKSSIEMTNPEIDFATLANLPKYTPIYCRNEDTFFVRPDEPQPATSVDWNGELWIRVNPDTGEVLGLEIEDFESVFLKKYPDLAKAWHDLKPFCFHKNTKKGKESLLETFIRILVQFVSDLLRNDPKQELLPLFTNL